MISPGVQRGGVCGREGVGMCPIVRDVSGTLAAARRVAPPTLGTGVGHMEVAPGIERCTHGVASWYLIEISGGVVLVDAGVPGDWRLLRSTLRARGRTLDDVQAVLVTHAHADHTGFAERARNEAQAAVWIHEADAEAARTGRVGKRDGSVLAHLWRPTLYRTLFSLLRRRGAGIVPIAELSTFADGKALDLPGRPVVMHAPGHTPGSSVMQLPGSRVLFTGDALATWNPLTRRVGPQVMPSAFNANTAQATQFARPARAIGEVDVLLPGHGDRWREGVATAVARAREAGPS